MPFVKEGDESNPDVSSLYKEIDNELQIGKIPNILKTTSIEPLIAKWFWEGVKIILLRESSIPRTLKESIAVVVSNANSCNYCTQAHSMLLQLMGFDKEKNLVTDIRYSMIPNQIEPMWGLLIDENMDVSAHAIWWTGRDLDQTQLDLFKDMLSGKKCKITL